MAVLDPDGNNDKHVPGSKGFEYLPSNYQYLTMEQKFRILALKEQFTSIADNPKLAYELFMDVVVMNFAQLNTFKKLLKDDAPKMPSPIELEEIIRKRKEGEN